MSPFTIAVGAFLVGLVLLVVVFGQVILALPIVAIGIAVLGLLDLRRRRNQSQSMQEFRNEAKAEEGEFTERDKETLASE